MDYISPQLDERTGDRNVDQLMRIEKIKKIGTWVADLFHNTLDLVSRRRGRHVVVGRAALRASAPDNMMPVLAEDQPAIAEELFLERQPNIPDAAPTALIDLHATPAVDAARMALYDYLTPEERFQLERTQHVLRRLHDDERAATIV